MLSSNILTFSSNDLLTSLQASTKLWYLAMLVSRLISSMTLFWFRALLFCIRLESWSWGDWLWKRWLNISIDSALSEQYSWNSSLTSIVNSLSWLNRISLDESDRSNCDLTIVSFSWSQNLYLQNTMLVKLKGRSCASMMFNLHLIVLRLGCSLEPESSELLDTLSRFSFSFVL